MLKLIYHLVKERGYTIQGARDVLRNRGAQEKDKLEIIESLEKVKAFLVSLKGQLDRKGE